MPRTFITAENLNSWKPEAYDVLQCKRAGLDWQDFSTLRDASDFAFARRYVTDPKAWRDSPVEAFRIVCMNYYKPEGSV